MIRLPQICFLKSRPAISPNRCPLRSNPGEHLGFAPPSGEGLQLIGGWKRPLLGLPIDHRLAQPTLCITSVSLMSRSAASSGTLLITRALRHAGDMPPGFVRRRRSISIFLYNILKKRRPILSHTS